MPKRGSGWGKVFPGVSRDAESDFDVRFTRRGPRIMQRRHGPLFRRCNAMSRRVTQRLSVALRPQGVLLVRILALLRARRCSQGGSVKRTLQGVLENVNTLQKNVSTISVFTVHFPTEYL